MPDNLTSLYPQAPAAVAPPANGFSNLTPTGVVGLVNGINQSRLFQQEYSARQGIADAYRDSTDPTTGVIDQQGLSARLARSGFGAGEALHQGAVNAATQLDLQTRRTQYLRDSIGAIADKPNPTKADVVGLGVSIHRNVPSLPEEAIQGFIDNAPENPRELKKYLVTQRNLAVGSAGLMPSVPGTVNPRTGVAPMVSQGQANYQNAGVGEGQPTNNGPGRVTALPIGSGSAMEDASKAYGAAIEGAGRYAQRVNPLRQVIPIVENMQPTDIGPTSEKWNNFKSSLQSLGAGPLLGIDPAKIADYNEAKKYLNQYALQSSSVLGPKTNDGLASAVSANPSMTMDKLSVSQLSKAALGMERMQQTGVREFQALVNAGKASPGDFNKFMLEFSSEHDPRGFVYDLLDGKGQKQMLDGLTPLQKSRIGDSMLLAKKWGTIGDVKRGG
jgi:hypothetical protein